jgi:AcrR family transcriptional regulator
MVDSVKRAYASDLRARQARGTRRAIVDAAAALFVAYGYGGTTIDAIATAAGVGRKTVFTSVGGKPDCLKLAIDWAIAGDDEPVPIMERHWVRSAMQSPDARWILRNYAEQYVAGAARAAALFEVLDDVVGLDETLRALHDDLERQRTLGMTNLAGHLDLRRSLRRGLSVPDAAQLLCLYTDGAVYQRLVARHGWPPARFVGWLADTLVAQLIRADYEPRPLPKTKRARELGVDVDALS